MKKYLFAAFWSFLAAPAVAGVFGADLREESMVVNYTYTAAVNASSAAVVIDLSDTTNWPHKKTSAINISAISIDVDKNSTSAGSVKLGVVTEVNDTSGTVRYFYTKSFTKNVAKSALETVQLESGLIRARVNSNGATPYLFTNDSDALSTIYQTDVTLPSPRGTAVAPAVGDIVMKVSNVDVANTFTVIAHVQYHVER